jgi:beta-phosphoglucomutase-like phosphatase (HAD superfamily)
MKTTTAIFDMDGLLIDSEPLWYEAAQESLTKFGIIIGEEQYVETTGLRTKEFLQHWFGVFNIEHAHIPKTEKVITDLVIAKVMESGTMMEGVNEVMEMVKQSSLKIGLASSSPLALIKAVLAKTKMEQHFSAICSAEFLPFGKPNPQVFINCAIELGSHPAACICFEDSFNGMIAAKAARMKCIVVPHPDQFHQESWNIADLKLDSLRSLAAQDFNALLA